MEIKKILILIYMCCQSFMYAQFGPVQYIDNDSDSGDTSYITTADINNDALLDVLVSKAYAADNITIYFNEGNGSFDQQIIAVESDPIYVDARDINGDGAKDLLLMTQSNGDLILRMNNNGSFVTRTVIDTESTFGKGLVIDDFDNDGDQDIVAIWQHAINYYENDGTGTFSKTAILTTSGSPNILECWTITKADVNADGNMDIVTGETIGAVVYLNNGNGNFTPHTVTQTNHTTITSLALEEIDGDNLLDLIFTSATGDASLYLNNNNTGTSFTHHSDLFSATPNSIKRLAVIEVNNDGLKDIYTAFSGNPRVFIQGNNSDFSQEIILDNNSSLFVDNVAVADIDNQSDKEFIWCSPANTIAYQKSTSLKMDQKDNNRVETYPNPMEQHLYFSHLEDDVRLKVYDISAKLLIETDLQPNQALDVTHLKAGLYFIKLFSNTVQQTLKVQKR
ncbi:T9SS type A sorting domain-containing protein [Mesonia sp. K7]|uniref:T9SS type A sorting domain-containing protein n=1 Tax=Mesonia sp. K7 TaxID=2218606 RepID=UPI000DA8FE62|nr:T9SS type A sorting domain-containing protein [Mesonia sp. K7]PZD77845.1 hypothetical protein DNG35_07030 [Mesonia sp. K7]